MTQWSNGHLFIVSNAPIGRILADIVAPFGSTTLVGLVKHNVELLDLILSQIIELMLISPMTLFTRSNDHAFTSIPHGGVILFAMVQ